MTSLKRAQCLSCGNGFKQQTGNQRFCSSACRYKYYQDKRGGSPLAHVTCDECGAEFMQRVGIQRFCSSDCATVNVAKGTFLIFERDSFSCFWCGKSSFEDRAELHLDHVFPLVAGGAERADNLVTACSSCNLEKARRILSKSLIERVIREVRKRNADHGLLDNQRIKRTEDTQRVAAYHRRRNE
jgi:hypothetical protein